ncbi:MAG: restriction endonuclease [Candidatus Aenigmatarchaeota archaeon]
MNISKQFEVLIGELYKRKGYRVELNKIVQGKSGAKHEFDGYCTKKRKTLVFEAKYSTLPVNLDDFSRFLTAVDDCKIKEAHMVTNSYYSENILSLAIRYNIKLIDGNRLKKELIEYNLDSFIIKNSFSNISFCFAKYLLDSLDKSKSLSKILIPSQNQVLYLNLSTDLRKIFESNHL